MIFGIRYMAWRACCWRLLAAALPAFTYLPGIAQSCLWEVPVLCYHQIRAHRPDDGAYARAITVPPAVFASHMKMLHDSGYTVILPDELYACYTAGKALPPRPVIISFDDNTSSQFTQALPVLDHYGFKATFFVMTVAIGNPGYMTKDQLRTLVRQGHCIGGHTWDHQNMKIYQAADWKKQLDQPLHTLQGITGDSIRYFAYPYGSWTRAALDSLRKRGIRMAFILHTAADTQYPRYTLRRLMVASNWSAASLAQKMRTTFPREDAAPESRR